MTDFGLVSTNGTSANMLNRRQVLSAAALSGGVIHSAFAQNRSVTFVGWSQDEAASKPTLNALFDNYRRMSGNNLSPVGYPWAQMQQNVELRMRTAQPLDVVQLAERWLPQFGSTERMVELNEVLGKDMLTSVVNPDILSLGKYRGRQLALPWTAGSIGLVANAGVLKNAGVAGVPETVDQFVSALEKIKKSTPEVLPYAFCTKNNNSMSPDFQVWLWTFGGRLFDDTYQVSVNSVEGVRALEFLTSIVKDGLAAREVDRPDARKMFGQGKTGFYHDAPLARGFARTNSGQGKAFDANVIAMPTPTLKAGGIPRSLAWGHLLASFDNGKGRPDAQSPQMKLITYLALNDDAQLRYFADVGLFPVTNAALAKLSSDAYVSVWSKAARTAIRDETSIWYKSADLTKVIGEEVQAALFGQKSPKDAIQSMAKRIDAKLLGNI